MKLYKKGSIIPRRIVQADHRSYQHRLKFGCDVLAHDGNVKALEDGSIILVPAGKNENKTGRGGIRNMSFTVKSVSIDGHRRNTMVNITSLNPY